MEGLLLGATSSERTRLEPPTPMFKLSKDTPKSSRKAAKARASMPSLSANTPDLSATPTNKRRKSHHGGESSRKHRDRDNDRLAFASTLQPASSPVNGRGGPSGPGTSPMMGYTPLGMGNLSALASTALALANAHPSERDAIVNKEEAKRMEKERRREEKRKRREAAEKEREEAATAAANAADDDMDDDDDAPKKKRKHKERHTPAAAALVYSLPAPGAPGRAADPATPTPKRQKHTRDANARPETPYTGPSRSAADVSMTALLMSGRKKRPAGDDDEGTRKRRESRSGADMSVSSLLVTPRPARSSNGMPPPPSTAGLMSTTAEEKRARKKEKKRDKKNKDRTVEGTMNVNALLATPGMEALPPSTPGYHLDTDGFDIPDTDGFDVDDESRPDRERRRAEKAERKARRKAEKKARKEREKENERPQLLQANSELSRDRVQDKAKGKTPQKDANRHTKFVSVLSDSDSDDDGFDPAAILRGMSGRSAAPAPVPVFDPTSILRGRPRGLVTPVKVPAAPAAAAAPKPAEAPRQIEKPIEKPAKKADKPKALAPVRATHSTATVVSNANTAAAFATAARTRKKSANDAASQIAADEQLRKELADESVMNEFLASKWIEIKELQRLEATGVLQYKRGRFSEEERSALRDWLDIFRQCNALSEDALLDIIMAKGKSGERSQYPKFYSDLAAQVPGRPVRYVKEAVKRMYDPRARKGAWTKKEDAELLRAYDLHPNEWTKIAAIVDRSESDCRDRWRGELKGQESRVSGAWSTKETDALTVAVTEANRRLQLGPTAPDTPWQVVVDLMGGKRSLTQCRKKWQDTILPELKAKEARDSGVHITKTSVSRRDLLDRLRALNVTHERDLSWTRVVPPEWDVKPGTLRGVWHRMKHGVEGWKGLPFPELLDRIEESL